MPTEGHNPQAVEQRFRREGWEFDKNVERKCLCPSCRAERNREKERSMATPAVKKAAEPTKPAPASPRTIADLSPANKAKVRILLDKHFDDAQGAYLDGYSDQRIGKETNLPWSLVAQMREAAYGEIRADHDADALRSEIKEIERKVAAEIAALAKKIDELAQVRR